MVAHRFPPLVGGVETHCYEVGRRMARAGHQVTILTTDKTGALSSDETTSGLRILRFGAYPGGSDVLFAPGVYRHLTDVSYDIVHVQGFHTFVPPLALMALVRMSRTFVMTFHSGGHSSALRRFVRAPQMRVLAPLIARADRLIAVSQFEAERFARGLGLSRESIAVVPNGAEIDASEFQAPVDRENPLVVTIGRLEKYKGHHRAIEAMPHLLSLRPGARLRIVGEGPYKDALQKLAQRLGVTDRVAIGGVAARDRSGLADLLSQAAAVVLLSDYEAHPVAALEAIALRRPVLASNTTGFSEMAASGLVRGIDPESPPRKIATEILDLVDSDGPRGAVKIWNWDDCTNALLALYGEALDARQRKDEAA